MSARADRRDFDALIEQARRIDMVALVERHGVKLRKVRHEYVGACPVCRTGDDRFSIQPNGELFNCRVCARGGKGAIDLQMFLTGDDDFVTAVKQLTGTDIPSELRTNTTEAKARERLQQQEQAAHEAAQHATAQNLWRGRQPAAGSLVETYLHARGYHFQIPRTIGFLPASEKYPPSMVSAFALPQEHGPGVLAAPCDVRSVHLTALLPDGSDRMRTNGAKKIIGRPLRRPIVVSPIGTDRVLCISEGVESALAFAAAGHGSWAAGSAPHLPPLAQTIPDDIERLIIEQHDDNDGQGQRGVARLIEAIREQERQGVRPGRPMNVLILGGD